MEQLDVAEQSSEEDESSMSEDESEENLEGLKYELARMKALLRNKRDIIWQLALTLKKVSGSKEEMSGSSMMNASPWGPILAPLEDCRKEEEKREQEAEESKTREETM